MGLIDLHGVLKSHEHNKQFYDASAAPVLLAYLQDYSIAHSWFHYYYSLVEDSDPEHYFHYAVVYWTDGQRPTMNIFNFVA